MNDVYKITEIFVSLEGEGLRSGEPAVFIRLFGCNLSCSFCDSEYSCKENYSYTTMTLDEIVPKVKQSGFENVTITGGEPLIHNNIDKLLKALSSAGYKINIETNGSVDISTVKRYKGLFFTCDYKCPYSGMTDKMCLSNLKHLTKNDVLKFVVADNRDLNEALRVIKSSKLKCYIYFSPVFGKLEPKEIAEFIKENKLNKVRLQLQLHKYIYPPEMRGV